MKIVTINIPNQYLDSLETLVELGFYPSRSEAVREALKQFITREEKFKQDIGGDEFKIVKQNQMEALIR